MVVPNCGSVSRNMSDISPVEIRNGVYANILDSVVGIATGYGLDDQGIIV
jgi:hypothetical protein